MDINDTTEKKDTLIYSEPVKSEAVVDEKVAKDEPKSKRRKKQKRDPTKPKRKPNAWIKHYMEWRKSNPDKVKELKVTELVKMAKASYTPVVKTIKPKKGYNPWLRHYKAWMAANPEKLKALGVRGAAKEAALSYKSESTV